ncbi:MAG TPA: ATP-binding protein [Chitinophagaceae bacterium]|jgi:hypothetical protein|nr:ATP-binding protein [Chitinophagaceae bacterium]
MKEIKSPFKFLDPYNKNDYRFFFGRKKEVFQLYDFVNKSRIVLLYGQSGTGKTSIIQCGLANEFEVTDWNPYYIRREDNLNDSFLNIIKNNFAEPSEEEIKNLTEILFQENTDNIHHEDDVKSHYGEKRVIAKVIFYLQKITEKYLRPVYLIFDQFEELLILASYSEKKVFLKTLDTLLGPNKIFDCHIIIVMREEYFAWLDEFEKEIPGISDHRLRIEPMRAKDIREVILDSCKVFNIKLTDPETNVTQIISALSIQGDISLPYLQVYLDQLWRVNYQNTYPGGYEGKEKFVPLTITTADITEFGEIKDVMQRFLLERKKLIQHELKEKFPDIPDTFLNSLLDCFVNEQGTKRPNAYDIEKGSYKFKKKSAKLLRDTDPEVLKLALDFLQKNQILRNSGSSFELGHDILAKLIDRQRDAKQKRLNGIRAMISIQKKTSELIPYDLVKSWDRYIELLDLRDDEKAFFEKSKSEGEKKEHAKLYEESVRKALDDYKFDQEKRKSKRNKRWLALTTLFTLLLGYILWNSLNKQDTYHAMDIISALETDSTIMSSVDKDKTKNDVLDIAKYVYDFKKYDSIKEDRIESYIMKVVSRPSFADRFSGYHSRLNSAATLSAGLDIDISGNGNFMSVRNDSALQGRGSGGQSTGGLFNVIDLKNKKTVALFKNVIYSYFLNRSDTLLLALSARFANVYAGNISDTFILYDCVRRSVIDTVALNQNKQRKYCLRQRYSLEIGNFSEWDSYKIRIVHPLKLVIPCQNFENGEGQVLLLDLTTGKREELYKGSSDFTVSTSKKYDKLLYCYKKGKNNMIVEIYNNNNGSRSVFNKNISYADFNDKGTIVYSGQNKIGLATIAGVIKEIAMKGQIKTIYTGNDENYLLAVDNSDNLSLIDFTEPAPMQFNERLVAYDFTNKLLVTHTDISNSAANAQVHLVLRDFSGREIRRVLVKGGIESFVFNPASGCFLLKSNKLPNNNLQLLYLFDCRLGLKGTFFLTPNDSYDFSKGGKKFYFVRDNELKVFEINESLDMSDFKSVNDWLLAEKKSRSNYKIYIKNLRNKYNLKPFPTQFLSFR